MINDCFPSSPISGYCNVGRFKGAKHCRIKAI